MSVAEVEGLLEGLDDRALEAVRALLDLYGEGLARLVDHVADHDDGSIAAAVAADDVVAQLLLVHGLHPVPLRDRVLAGLQEVRPYLESHGGDVELLDIADGVVHLRMHGACKGCPSSGMTLKLAIEQAVLKAAPDVERIEAETAAEPALLQIEMRVPGFTAANGIAVGGDGPLLKEVAGTPLVFLRVGGTAYAYKAACPSCGASLAAATLSGARLACTTCDARYDVVGAGRCLTAPELHLEPVPLLEDAAGAITVAVA